MPKVSVPKEKERKILRDNGLDPDEYGVTYRDESAIWLLCYKTRDLIKVERGDRPW